MKRIMMGVVVLSMVMLMAGIAVAQQKGPAAVVQEGCKADIAKFCKDVTQGEGRVLACLYAYGDKLSNRCEYALYDASAQLQRAVTALNYAATECRDDLQKFCSDVKSGEGRLMQCLDKNSAKVSTRCKQALKDTGLK